MTSTEDEYSNTCFNKLLTKYDTIFNRDDGCKEGAVGYSLKDDGSNTVVRPNLTPELEEARRRRLQKFGQTTSD